MAFRIDQAGLTTGVVGRSRTDGLLTGALVTLTNTGGGSTLFRLLWVPGGDTTAVASLVASAPGSNVWTFSPTVNRPGTYRIELVKDLGLPGETTEQRVLRMRTPNRGLIILALNEVAEPTASLLNNGADVVAKSNDNATDYAAPLATLDYAGWWRAHHDQTIKMDTAGLTAVLPLSRLLYVDPLTAATVRDGSISNPFNSVTEAHAVINAAAANTSWVVVLQTGQTYNLGTAALPVGRHVTYMTSASVPDTTDTVTDTIISGNITVATGFDLCFRGLNVGVITFNGAGRVVAVDCRIAAWKRASGTAGQASIFALSCTIAGLTWENSQDNCFDLNAIGCTFVGTSTVSGYNLLCRDCSFTAAGVIEARLTAQVFTSAFSAVATLAMINVAGVCVFYLDEVSRSSADQAGVTYSNNNTSFVSRIGERSVTRYVFKAEDFLLTNSADWAVNSTGSVGASATFPFQVGSLDGTTQEGFGLTFAIPDGKTMVAFEFWYTRSAGTGGTGAVLSTQRKQAIGNGGSSFAWSSAAVLATLPAVTSSTYWRRYRMRTTLAALSMEDRSYQVLQLLRTPANAGDDFTDDLVIREIVIELT